MTVRLRDLRPGEEHTVQAVFDGLSPASRHRRFHGPMPSLAPAVRRVLADADGHHHVVLVAEEGRGRRRHPVGLVRLVRTGPDRAEMAIEVVDAAHGRGIGRRLLVAARQRAIHLGYRVLEADVLVDNAPMLHLIGQVFTGIRTARVGDAFEMRLPVPSGDLDLRDVLPPALAGVG